MAQRSTSAPGLRTHVAGLAAMHTRAGALGDSAHAPSLVIAAAQGGLAYALLAPKWFARVHPVWGGIFAVLSVFNLADAVG